MRAPCREWKAGGGEQVAQGGPGAEEARTDGVERQREYGGDLVVGELLELAQEENFALVWIEASKRVAEDEVGVDRGAAGEVLWLGIALEEGAKGGLPAMGAEDLVGDGVKIRAKEGRSLVAISGAEDGDEGVLR